jgi:hypothetical protein
MKHPLLINSEGKIITRWAQEVRLSLQYLMELVAGL